MPGARLGGSHGEGAGQSRPRAAFTLVELTVVLLLMAILAVMAAPRYSSALAYYRVNGAAGRIASDLRMIRQYARRTSIAQSVVFDTSTHSYTAATVPDVTRRSTGYTVNLWSSDYLSKITAATFGGSATVQFDIYGKPGAAGTVVVTSGGLQRTVEVDEGGNVRTY